MTHRPLVPSAIGVVALLGFGSIWVAIENSDSPASTVTWFVSESALALAILVPAICLYFVIRAVHARRLIEREAALPASDGVRQASEILWSLSHGLLPQTLRASDIPTDATESVFLAEAGTVAQHRHASPSTRLLTSSARALAAQPANAGGTEQSPSGERGWGALGQVTVAATDRRLLLRTMSGVTDVPYANITAVHLVPGAVVIRLSDEPPMLVLCAHAESVAVLAVWGSAGEAALKRHPDFVPLRSP